MLLCSQMQHLAPQPEDAEPQSLSLGQWELWNVFSGLSLWILEDVGVVADPTPRCVSSRTGVGRSSAAQREGAVGGWDPPRLALVCPGEEGGGKGRESSVCLEMDTGKEDRELPFFPGSELTLSTTSAPPEPTLLQLKGVLGGSHSHTEPSPWCSCSPVLLVLCCRIGISSVLHTGQVHSTQTWAPGGVQAAPRDTSGHIWGSGKVLWVQGKGSALLCCAHRLSTVEPQEPHGMFCTWPSPRFNTSHLDLHQHRELFKECPVHSNQPAG